MDKLSNCNTSAVRKRSYDAIAEKEVSSGSVTVLISDFNASID